MKEKWQSILDRMMADKKKFYFLVALGVFSLLLWGRLLLKQVPRTALANEAAQVAMVDQPDNTSARAVLRKIVYVQLSDNTVRDIFKLHTHYYSPQEQPKPPKQEKLYIDPTDNVVEQLVLQGTMGQTAMINNQMIRVGRTIGGCLVKEIRAGMVIVQRNGRYYKLKVGE